MSEYGGLHISGIGRERSVSLGKIQHAGFSLGIFVGTLSMMMPILPSRRGWLTISGQPIFFLCLWMSLKLYRGKNPWKLVSLDHADTVINKMEQLDGLRWRNTESSEEPDAWYNMWGIFERLDKRNWRL